MAERVAILNPRRAPNPAEKRAGRVVHSVAETPWPRDELLASKPKGACREAGKYLN